MSFGGGAPTPKQAPLPPPPPAAAPSAPMIGDTDLRKSAQRARSGSGVSSLRTDLMISPARGLDGAGLNRAG